jgi:hypothetical protein
MQIGCGCVGVGEGATESVGVDEEVDREKSYSHSHPNLLFHGALLIEHCLIIWDSFVMYLSSKKSHSANDIVERIFLSRAAQVNESLADHTGVWVCGCG